MYKRQTQNFQRIIPCGIAPLKKAHEAGTCWFPLIYEYQIFKKYQKGMDKSNKIKWGLPMCDLSS